MPDPSTEPLAWHLRPAKPDLVRDLSAHLHCPPPIAHLLVSRGIVTPEQAEAFLHPTLADLHPPLLMLGMDRAVARIQQAVANAEPILIYGDYDVDGTTATVLLKTAIDRVTPDRSSPDRMTPDRSGPDRTASYDPSQSLVTWHVPHRIREGYGMQGARLSEAAAAGIRLVISVDTGIRAFAAAAEARALGLDLIVTDHHLPDDYAGLPDALAVLNPAQPGCPYPFKSLCGAAVAFKLAHALLLAQAESQPDPAPTLSHLNTRLLPSFLKLVAIATVADSVPLVGENRVIASLGLRELANPVQPGLRELMRVADLPLDRPPTATEVGFRIAPRINAAGRMDIADDVIELFLTRSPQRATDLAHKLDSLNQDRRSTEREALDDIEQRLAHILSDQAHFPAETIVLDHPDWHRGVLGILASRIVDRTGRPALVLTHETTGPEGSSQAHGSGRSIAGFHLLDALTAVHAVTCDQAPAGTLFTRFGGHAHAVGFSLPSPHVSLLRDRLRSHGAPILTSTLLNSPLLCDAELPPGSLTEELCDWIDRCAPFGNSHPEPVFTTRSLVLAAPIRLIKDRHVCLQLVPSPGCPPLQAIGWSRSTIWPARCKHLNLNSGASVDLAYRLRKRTGPWFNGLELDLLSIERSREQTSPPS